MDNKNNRWWDKDEWTTFWLLLGYFAVMMLIAFALI